MRKVSLIVATAMVLASCREEAPPAPEPSPSESTSTSTSESTVTVINGARSVVEETDDFLFEYSYPAEAGNIPALAGLLDERLARARSELSMQAADGREAASDDGFPYNKYSNEVIWQVVTNLPGFLSLSARISSYTGGAHGNYGSSALLWDKTNEVELDPLSAFTSAAALDEALGETLCEALNSERAKRRGTAVEGEGDIFDACVKPSESTVLLGSSNGRAFNRIGFVMDPYVAGPYAEGSYEFTLNVNQDVLDAVKEEYRSAFAARN